MTVNTRAEKVRGMNASLMNGDSASVGGSPLSEREPGRLHITRRQMAFAAALSVVAVLAAIFTVNSIQAGAQSFPAVVSTSKVYDLNFTNDGMVTAVLVKVGDRVKQGQVLATQADSSLQTQLAADQATVKADREVLIQSGAPNLTAAQLEQDNLQVQQAQTSLNNAQAALQSAEGAGKANVAAAQAAVTSAQSQESSDNGTYTTACPNGAVTPDPGLSGVQLQTAQSSFTHCQSLQLTLSQDQAAVEQSASPTPGHPGAGPAVDRYRPGERQQRPGRTEHGELAAVHSNVSGDRIGASSGASESEPSRIAAGPGTERSDGCTSGGARWGRRDGGVWSARGNLGAGRGPQLPSERSGSSDVLVRIFALPCTAHIARCFECVPIRIRTADRDRGRTAADHGADSRV